jgi:hypothetical protein
MRDEDPSTFPLYSGWDGMGWEWYEWDGWMVVPRMGGSA